LVVPAVEFQAAAQELDNYGAVVLAERAQLGRVLNVALPALGPELRHVALLALGGSCTATTAAASTMQRRGEKHGGHY